MSNTDGTAGTTGGTNDAAAQAAAAAAASAAQPKWYDSYDAETKGYLQNRGVMDKPLPEVVKNLADAHRNAERMLGAPADQLLRLPKDPNDPAWANVRSRLGVPADAKEYKFDDIKFADGTAPDEKFTNFIREKAFAAHLSAQQAADMARAMVGFMDSADADEMQIKTAALAQEKDKLLKNWGANTNANMVVAQNAAAKFGITAAEVTALEGVIGYSRIMEMFRDIGTKIGEDKFIQSPAGGAGGGVMTAEQAKAQIAALKADKEWGRKYTSGDAGAKSQLDNLLALAVG